jgi:hypothetical protein
VDSVFYSSSALVTGALLSIFFKRKVAVMGYATGFGLGFAVQKDAGALIKHIRTN